MAEEQFWGGAASILLEEWRRAQRLGLLGPGPVEHHLTHAEGFVRAVGDPGGRCLDLGSGAGVPGLALAWRWPGTSWALVESQRRRADFLRGAVARLELGGRVEVAEERAEVLGHLPAWRGTFDLVVARCFAAPGITAEVGAAFLVPGGRLVVSEPAEAPPGQRWDPERLEALGLRRGQGTGSPAAVVVLERIGPYPESLPRRPAAMARRPWF